MGLNRSPLVNVIFYWISALGVRWFPRAQRARGSVYGGVLGFCSILGERERVRERARERGGGQMAQNGVQERGWELGWELISAVF